MKKPFALLAAVCAISLALPAQAQTEPTVTVHTTNTDFVYWKDFDVLALDFTINTVAGDALKALTVAKSGSAWEGYEYVGTTLWADRGVAGFQGWGYDEKIAEGEYKSGLWVFSSIDVKFADASQRFFVSIDTGAPFDRSLQLSILATGEDGDGVYENGEQGVFLANGVVKQEPNQYFSQTIRFKPNKSDFTAPKAYVANLSVDPSQPTVLRKLPTDSVVTFTGEARDRNGDNVLGVKLLVNEHVILAESVTNGFAEWKAVYVPTQSFEPLTVRVYATDGTREFTSEEYYAVVDARNVSPSKSVFAALPDAVMAGSETDIQVTLRADDNSAIAKREVTFQSVRGGDTLLTTSVMTDANGFASVKFKPNAFGIAVVKVIVDGLEVGSIDVSVAESTEPVPPIVVENPLAPGKLVKGSLSAVYYIGSDNKRHVFENNRVYQSWYGTDFSDVITVSDELLASRALGEHVPYRPGSLLKVPSVPAVYVVDAGNVLRHVTTEAIARELFGETWNKKVNDLPESLLFSYEVGSPIENADGIDMNRVLDPFLTVDDELNA